MIIDEPRRNVREIDVRGEQRRVFFKPLVQGPYSNMKKNYVKSLITDETIAEEQDFFYFGHNGNLFLATVWNPYDTNISPCILQGYLGGVRFEEKELQCEALVVLRANKKAAEFDPANADHLSKRRRRLFEPLQDNFRNWAFSQMVGFDHLRSSTSSALLRLAAVLILKNCIWTMRTQNTIQKLFQG